MELVKQTPEYSVYKKRSGRYAVKAKNKRYLNGDAKTEILLKEKLIKVAKPKKKEEPKAEAAEAAPAEEVAAEAAPAEEAAEPAAEEGEAKEDA